MGGVDDVRGMSRRYGASPLHLLAHLVALALAAWALLQLADMPAFGRVAAWLVAAVVLHDLVVLPAYSALDRAAQRGAGPAVNFVRVPAAISLLLLAVFWGTIADRGEGAYRRASGLEFDGYLQRWLLITAALFASAALAYAVRGRWRHEDRGGRRDEDRGGRRDEDRGGRRDEDRRPRADGGR
jgi:hypothetical protein